MIMRNILKSVDKTAKGFKKSGVIDKTTMRKFDVVCLTIVHQDPAVYTTTEGFSVVQ